MIDWTEEKLQFILQLAAANVSRTQIAKEMTKRFNEPVTRCMVTGKLNRSRDKGYVPMASPIIRRPVVPQIAAPIIIEPEITIPDDDELELIEVVETKPSRPRPPLLEPPLTTPKRQAGYRLDGSGCRWPIGDPKSPDFHFCNNPLSHLNDAYCKNCRKGAYLPAKSYPTAPDAGARLSANGD